MTENKAQAVTPPVIEKVLSRITSLEKVGGMQIAKNYSAPNALRAAWLILNDTFDKDGQCILKVTSEPSQANALFRMVSQGLNPLKRQCSFIKYGNRLICQREYQGSIAMAKRYGMKSIFANPVFSGDEFAWEINPETGRKKITKHVVNPETYGKEVKFAYAVLTYEDGTTDAEIMSMEQIRKSWDMGKAKGNSIAHNNFTDEMACKTVINRATKDIINSSSDADLFEDEEPEYTVQEANVKAEIDANANKLEIGFDTFEEVEQQPANIAPEPIKETTEDKPPF